MKALEQLKRENAPKRSRPRAKKSKCPSCCSLFLKGKHVLRITTDGAARQRVCQPCASLATLVLASDAPAHCEVCRRALARVCLACVGEAFRGTAAAEKLTQRLRASGHADVRPATPDEWDEPS